MAPPHHPLRRISTGSLTSLARSQDRAPSSHVSDLAFLQPALTDLADEAATLASNLQRMTRLHDALGTFNEAFAAYLYAMRMNAFCVEWPEAPSLTSFERAASLAPPIPPTPAKSLAPSSTAAGAGYGDTTYATAYSSAALDDSPPAPTRASVSARGGAAGRARGRGGAVGASAVGRGGKRVVSATEKRKRDLAIANIIDTMPLEYRGAQPAARLLMEKVLIELLSNPAGRKLNDLIQPPELTQAKVNKCLIALVQKKVVQKTVTGGVAMYRLV